MSTWSQVKLQDIFSTAVEKFIHPYDFLSVLLLFNLSFETPLICSVIIVRMNLFIIILWLNSMPAELKYEAN